MAHLTTFLSVTIVLLLSLACFVQALEVLSRTPVKLERSPFHPNQSIRRVLPGETVELEIALPALYESVEQIEWHNVGRIAKRDRQPSSPVLKHTRADGTRVFVTDWHAPMHEGTHELQWNAITRGKRALSDSLLKNVLTRSVTVTCDNGKFCDGFERLVNGVCVSSNKNPCDDGFDCTKDVCSEYNGGQCKYEIDDEDTCLPCVQGLCEIQCDGKECGEDGCNGNCGTCKSGLACIEGKCLKTEARDGTCSAPIRLLEASESFFGVHEIHGDTNNGINIWFPKCNALSGAAELIYSFTVPSDVTWVGMEARVSGYDTVLQMYGAKCGDINDVIACSDDSTPPGAYGSRIQSRIEAGKTYHLMVDGFNIEAIGEFTLTVKFVSECVPACDGSFCNDDGCGGSCGSCESGTLCDVHSGRCLPNPCVPSCLGRECGFDGCFGACGQCGANSYCLTDTDEDGVIFENGQCSVAIPTCDNLNPVCSGCTATQYCGVDCVCYEMTTPLPDLYMDVDELNDAFIDLVRLPNTSCAVQENCVLGPGDRKLLRFTVIGVNQGQADFASPDPKLYPSLYQYGRCHGHYHFLRFAEYHLLNMDGSEVVNGRKEAYCMEDTIQRHKSPAVQCSPQFDCGKQGIQRGWQDTYGSSLDCQWVDVTDVPPGKYRLQIFLNPARRFIEISHDNNNGEVIVTIPDENNAVRAILSIVVVMACVLVGLMA